jgi:hypothetical protein
MQSGLRAIPSLDPTKASIARFYDASLDGKDNFQADRAAFREILKVAPHQGEVSRMNRYWLERVVSYLANRVGIDQFLDLGSGLPTVENTHDVAQRRNPETRVVYVDGDPTCCAHGRAMLATNDHTLFVEADLTKPAELLDNPEISSQLDFDRPIALMLVSTLHHVPDENDPAGIMTEYIDALPSNSYVAITHFWDPGEENPELSATARDLEHAFTQLALGSGYYRSRKRIAELFGSLEMIAPGLVELDAWWPGGPPLRELWPEEHLILGGVGRKQ